VRFADFGDTSLDIDVFAYIAVLDSNESLAIREEMLLAIYEQFEAAGIGIAIPTRTVILSDMRSEQGQPGQGGEQDISRR